MSGIFGVVHRTEQNFVQKEHLIPMLNTEKMISDMVPMVRTYGWSGFGVIGYTGRVSGISETSINGKPVALCFFGNILNQQEWQDRSKSFSNLPNALLELYLDEGQEFLKRLRGEFVIAVSDGTCGLFFLATDRFRIHSLYIYQDSEKLVFSSRLQGVLACPLVPEPNVNPRAIVALVGSSRIPTPETFFSGISKLPAGRVLECRRGSSQMHEYSYWDISYAFSQEWSESDFIERVRSCLQNSVSLSYHSDCKEGRVGTFLSGGIDSTTVTGLLSSLSSESLKSFSIGFGENQYDEMKYAKIAAQAFHVEHIQKFLTPHDCFDVIPNVIDFMDEPIGNASCVPTYCCALLAKQAGIQFLYAGDGGDEIFAGNERYSLNRLFDYYFKIPSWLRESFLAPFFEKSSKCCGGALFRKGNNFIQKAKTPYPQRLYAYNFYQLIPLQDIFQKEFLDVMEPTFNPYWEFHHWYSQTQAFDILDRQLYLDMKLTITDNDLIKVTRMTEAAGVTVRYPFLDHQLVELASQIPPSLKMEGLKLRSFFKKAYQDFLPAPIRSKTKHGFGLPIPIWLRSYKPLKELMYDLILSEQFFQRGYFKKQAVYDLVEKHQKDKTSFYGTILWNLMVLELWQRAQVGKGVTV